MGFIQDYYDKFIRRAEATKVLLEVEESNLDHNDPESLLYSGTENENENKIDNP